MGLLDKLWDDVMAGPVPHQDHGLGKLRTISTLNIKEGEGEGSKQFQRSLSMPTGPETPTSLPMTPTTPSPTALRKENVWRSVFNPGSNLATKGIGGAVFDKPHPKSPTVYDWLYSGETKSEHRGG
ncbi:dormancy-associated protein 1-like [Rhododendron vialii]|uniref:dormancy-associated protein 1-like n=1 Tax=Rhododendron vialii TaxID=182163 RepID=UPI00265E7D72|nr:dormancy-associated protein 1-like [Rhododendron vialii]